MLSEWAVMENESGVVLNYYGPCAISVETQSAQRMALTQNTDYPLTGHIEIVVGVGALGSVAAESAEVELPLSLRIPAWSRETSALLNGEPIAASPGEYLVLDRLWRDGDRIALDLDMSLRPLFGHDRLEGQVCLYRGPILLAYDRRFNAMDPDQVPAPAVDDGDAEVVPWSGPRPSPWLLVRLDSVGGEPLYLCDFASAGAGGTPYRSWLPRV